MNMKHFNGLRKFFLYLKNTKFNFCGFTFIEVVLTIAIIGSVLTALFTLQSTIFRALINDYSKISRIYYLKNFFFEFDNIQKIEKSKLIKRELKDPLTSLTFELKKPRDNSALKKFNNIFLLQANGKWRGFLRDQEENIISCIYIKPKKEQK